MQLFCHNICLYRAHNVQILVTLSEMCTFNYVYIVEFIVKGGLHFLKGVSNFSSLPFTNMGGPNVKKYDLNAKTCNLINTSMTKVELYRHHKIRLYGRTVLFDCIRLYRCA